MDVCVTQTANDSWWQWLWKYSISGWSGRKYNIIKRIKEWMNEWMSEWLVGWLVSWIVAGGLLNVILCGILYFLMMATIVTMTMMAMMMCYSLFVLFCFVLFSFFFLFHFCFIISLFPVKWQTQHTRLWKTKTK